jgi:hypothetical protein
MKKFTLLLIIMMSSVLALGIISVDDHYYDQKDEGILVPLLNCDYAVGFQFFSEPKSIAGLKRKEREEIPSNMSPILMEKIGGIPSSLRMENHYLYFTEQIPPRGGMMRLVYIFEDRAGNLYRRIEDVFDANYHQKFPAMSAIPRQCRDKNFGSFIDTGRNKLKEMKSRMKKNPRIKKGVRKIKEKVRGFRRKHNF